MKLSKGQRLVVATHNAGKRMEVMRFLASYGLDLAPPQELGLTSPEEDGDTFEENALIKARAATDATGLASLADDSGLEVDALGGAPGVYSARLAGKERDFAAAMREINRLLGTTKNRRGRFVCAIACVLPGGRAATWRGVVEGSLTWPPRGSYGFGYDPMFVPVGHRRSFGEMLPTEKTELSHRIRALKAFAAACCPDPHARAKTP